MTREDSTFALASNVEANNNAFLQRFKKRTYTFIDGTNSGQQITYYAPEVDISAIVTGALTATADGVSIYGSTDGTQAAGSVKLVKTASTGDIIVDQGAAAAASGYWPVRNTDGTNLTPALDVAARAGFVKVTDGTNTLPTLDTVARSGFVQLTDGTRSVGTDANTSALQVGGKNYEVTGSAAAAGNLTNFPVDAGGYSWVSVHITSNSATVNFDTSNDGTNYINNGLILINAAINPTGGNSSATTTGVFHGPLPCRYLRLRQSGAGATAATVEFYAFPRQLTTTPNQALGAAATGAALNGNPVRIGGSDGTNTQNIITDTNGILQAFVGRAALPVYVSATAAAASNAVAMPATSGKTNFCTGFQITADGPTAATQVTATLAGLATANGSSGTLSYRIQLAAVPSATTPAATGMFPLIVKFDPALPASAANSAITLTMPSTGTGGTSAATITGYQI